jgi:lipoyl(octanoyl) transferase
MFKKTLIALSLPLVSLLAITVATPLWGVSAQSSSKTAHSPQQTSSAVATGAATGTLQKMIVENGSVTMDLDLNRLNGINVPSQMEGRAPASPEIALASRELRPPDLRVHWLGRMEFADALTLQEEIVARKRNDPSMEDQLLLLEHEPVYTIGRTPDRSSLSVTGRIRHGELSATHLPYPLFVINRGGQATYHGPGQLIGYPIIDLHRCGQDLHKYLRWLEHLLINLLAEYGIASSRRESLTGVWVGDRKIASIGVGVRHWITMHGFALNVCSDLSPFDHIVPCGINNVAMTSMEKETGAAFSVADVAMSMERLALKQIGDLRVLQDAQTINV